MTDWLEELLSEREAEDEAVVWWKERRVRPVPGEQTTQTAPDGTVGRQENVPERAGSRAWAEAVIHEQTGEWTARELERIRRAARRVGLGHASQQTVKANESKMGLSLEGKTSPALRNSPAAGRQGLTARIDMEFRRDARRYDGRLGLL